MRCSPGYTLLESSQGGTRFPPGGGNNRDLIFSFSIVRVMSWDDLGNDILLGTGSRYAPDSEAGLRETIRMTAEDRSKHMFVCGSTGSGKSRFLQSLLRQDIENWKSKKCGVMLIDPHGEIYENTMAYLARDATYWRSHGVPILAIDLTQEDWITGYNFARPRPGMKPEAVAENAAEAIAHAFGASDLKETPSLSKLLEEVIALYVQAGLPLSSVRSFLRPENLMIRQEVLRRAGTEPNESDFGNKASMKDLALTIQGIDNRFAPIVSKNPDYLSRMMLSSLGGSLDFRTAVDEGYIILLNCSSAKGVLSKSAARTLTTLLLADLWQTMEMRGKSKQRQKPFYLYIDEFQRFVTPSIAQYFSEARGFGLHTTVACQYLAQLRNVSSDFGETLYREVEENALTKVCFGLKSSSNLKEMTEIIFRGTFDPNQEKLRIESTKVIGYERGFRHAWHSTESETNAIGVSEAFSESEGTSQSDSEMFTGSIGFLGLTKDDDQVERFAAAVGTSAMIGRSTAQSSSRAVSYSQGESVAETLDPILGKELSSITFRPIEEQVEIAMGFVAGLEKRGFVAKVEGQELPYHGISFFVDDVSVPSSLSEAFVEDLNSRFDFVLSHSEAARLQKEEEENWRKVCSGLDVEEPDEDEFESMMPVRRSK